MSARRSQKPPSQEELLKAVQPDDTLTIALRGHQYLDTLLDLAISEALPVPHAVEVSRLSFRFKTDLAVGLRIIPGDCRPGFLRLNNVRNQLAHDQSAEFTDDDARRIYSSLSPRLRQAMGRESDTTATPHHILRRCIQMLFAVIQLSVTSMRDAKIRHEILGEIVDELTGPPPPQEELEKSPNFSRVEQRVKEERERRLAAGDL